MVKTAANGDFNIPAASGDHTLTVSGPGIDTKNVNVKVSGSGQSVGNISTAKSGDMTMVLLLIVILAIAIVLVVVLVILRKRNRGRKENLPYVAGPSYPAPAVGTASDPIPNNCPYCGTETMGMPFCGNCGKKLG